MQGISVYERAGRPTWYIAYDCPRKLKRVNESSGFRLDDPRGKIKAYALARERSQSGVVHGLKHSQENWSVWVEPWLRDRYRHQARTLTSYLGAWKFLAVFLHEQGLHCPRLLEYRNVVDFVHWRESEHKRSGRKVGRNTALHNVKILSRIMREAVRRGYAQGNPCERLGEDVSPDPTPEKPELTDQQIEQARAILREHVAKRPESEWMAIAFEIALHQGCRLSATQIPMERIDFTHGTIRFVEKGSRGKPTVFTAPIHPGVRPLLERLRDERRQITCTIPVFGSRNFGRLMRRHGLPTFHSTRVTVVTRLARADVPEQKAMAYVHHGSWLIHKVYQRLKPADVSGLHDALGLPPASSSDGAAAPGSGPQQTPDAGRASG